MIYMLIVICLSGPLPVNLAEYERYSKVITTQKYECYAIILQILCRKFCHEMPMIIMQVALMIWSLYVKTGLFHYSPFIGDTLVYKYFNKGCLFAIENNPENSHWC